ncbi:hypothetical protein [Tsuneonella sp. HG222]
MPRAALRDRLPGAAALAIPVLAGIAWMAAYGAPYAFLLVNAGSLALGLLLALFGRAPQAALPRRIACGVLLALLFLPLATGPELNGITRWLSLGPIALHAGMLAFPALAVLAARDPAYAPPILLAALFAALLQPDAATGFAATFAAVGLHHVGKDWKVATVAIVGFVSAIFMALRGELPAQRFVEGVLSSAMTANPLVALALALALGAGYLLIVHAAPLARAERFALAGSFFGFVIIAMMNHYPYPLIGYGAAPIVGYGLALGLVRSKAAA